MDGANFVGGASFEVIRAGDTFPNFHTSITLVRAGGRVILVDPGYISDERHLWAGLRSTGVAPEAVDLVLNTHSHLDHCASSRHFPRDRVVFHRREVEDMARLLALAAAPGGLERTLAQRFGMTGRQARACAQIVVSGRGALSDLLGPAGTGAGLVLLDGEAEVAPGVRVIETPGHTAGHLSLLVETAGEGLVLVAGDAIATATDLCGGPVPMLTGDAAGFLATRQRLLELDWRVVIPGHGPPQRRDAATGAAGSQAATGSATGGG